MNDWAAERAAIREWLHPRCTTRGEFEFYEQLFEDLTDMADGMMGNDPVLWYHYVTAEDTGTRHRGFELRRAFQREAWERGYDLQ